MTLTLHAVLTATEFDDRHLIAAAMGNHFGRHFRAANQRRADVNVVAVGNQQHLVKLDRFAGSDFDLLKLEGLAFLNAVLLPPLLITAYMSLSGRRYCRFDNLNGRSSPDALVDLLRVAPLLAAI